MTLISDALNRVARQVSVDTPDSWLTATDAEYVEIRDDFLLETVDEVLDRLDLPSPIGKQYQLTGDGSETYTLPADFKRLMRDNTAVYESTTNRRACIPVTDDGIWQHIKDQGAGGVERYYRLSGYDGNYSISFLEEPTSGHTIYIAYVSNLWMADNAGTAGSAFTMADDVLMLPRRLIEAGTVARWRMRKGMDPTDKVMEFERELSRLSNDSRARRTIHFGDPYERRRPWDVPVPDFIPSS